MALFLWARVHLYITAWCGIPIKQGGIRHKFGAEGRIWHLFGGFWHKKSHAAGNRMASVTKNRFG
jgi:hypothetical protein